MKKSEKINDEGLKLEVGDLVVNDGTHGYQVGIVSNLDGQKPEYRYVKDVTLLNEALELGVSANGINRVFYEVGYFLIQINPEPLTGTLWYFTRSGDIEGGVFGMDAAIGLARKVSKMLGCTSL